MDSVSVQTRLWAQSFRETNEMFQSKFSLACRPDVLKTAFQYGESCEAAAIRAYDAFYASKASHATKSASTCSVLNSTKSAPACVALDVSPLEASAEKASTSASSAKASTSASSAKASTSASAEKASTSASAEKASTSESAEKASETSVSSLIFDALFLLDDWLLCEDKEKGAALNVVGSSLSAAEDVFYRLVDYVEAMYGFKLEVSCVMPTGAASCVARPSNLPSTSNTFSPKIKTFPAAVAYAVSFFKDASKKHVRYPLLWLNAPPSTQSPVSVLRDRIQHVFFQDFVTADEQREWRHALIQWRKNLVPDASLGDLV